MDVPSPASELLATLGRAEAALGRDDRETADQDMRAAADLCRRLQAAGIRIPASELNQLRDLADRLGLELARLARELNAESFRDENHRRGIVAYHGSLRR